MKFELVQCLQNMNHLYYNIPINTSIVSPLCLFFKTVNPLVTGRSNFFIQKFSYVCGLVLFFS